MSIMAVWRSLDSSREKVRFANAGLDLGCRTALIFAFAGFVGFLFVTNQRILFYPWMLLFPVAAALLYDSAWIWGMGFCVFVLGLGAAVVEGLFAQNVTASLAAFVFSAVSLWMAAGLDRNVQRVDDARVLGRVAVRESEEKLTELERVTLPGLHKHVQQLDLQLAKYDRLNRLLLDVPEGKGLPAVSEFYVREAEHLIGRGHAEFYIESGEDNICVTAGGAPAESRHAELMQQVRPMLSDTRGEISVPVSSDGRPVGILRLKARQGELSETDLRMLDSLSILASISVMNSLLYKRMEQLARTDGQTGLGKRIVFDEALRDELHRAGRHGQRLSVAMIDIDFFRNFNNRYGHLTGDWVLREIGRYIREWTPPYAVTARWGGEEFAVLLPNEDAETAATRIRQLQAALAERMRIPPEIAEGAADERVTFSAGISQFPDQAQNADQLIQLADEALYRAKNSGRNRVVVHGA